MKLNPLDRMMSWVAPQAGLARARSRAALDMVRGHVA